MIKIISVNKLSEQEVLDWNKDYKVGKLIDRTTKLITEILEKDLLSKNHVFRLKKLKSEFLTRREFFPSNLI